MIVCLSVFVCVCVCPAFASHISETSEAILAHKFASVTRMHHMLITLTLIIIQGHIDLNHENIKWSIISETVQPIPIKFAVKIVRWNVYISYYLFSVLWPCSSLKVTMASQTWQVFNLYCNSDILDSIKAIVFKLGMMVDLCMVYHTIWAHAHVFSWPWLWFWKHSYGLTILYYLCTYIIYI